MIEINNSLLTALAIVSKYPDNININPFKKDANTGSSLKKLTILSP